MLAYSLLACWYRWHVKSIWTIQAAVGSLTSSNCTRVFMDSMSLHNRRNQPVSITYGPNTTHSVFQPLCPYELLWYSVPKHLVYDRADAFITPKKQDHLVETVKLWFETQTSVWPALCLNIVEPGIQLVIRDQNGEPCRQMWWKAHDSLCHSRT